jgi:hypothetical protein
MNNVKELLEKISLLKQRQEYGGSVGYHAWVQSN